MPVIALLPLCKCYFFSFFLFLSSAYIPKNFFYSNFFLSVPLDRREIIFCRKYDAIFGLIGMETGISVSWAREQSLSVLQQQPISPLLILFFSSFNTLPSWMVWPLFYLMSSLPLSFSRAQFVERIESMQKKETLFFFPKCKRKKKKHESLLCHMRNRKRTTDGVIKRIQKPDTVLNMWDSFCFGNVCESFYHCRINFSSMRYRWIPFIWIALCVCGAQRSDWNRK